jgi:hypothetical protein
MKSVENEQITGMGEIEIEEEGGKKKKPKVKTT